MSVDSFELIATKRTGTGKVASRCLRQEKNQVPAILYGGQEANLALSLDHNKLLQITVHEKFYSQILTLIIDGTKQKVVLKDLQRHPFKPKFLHLDFQRVKETDIITMKVPLHFIGADKCPGVKMGGVINHHANDVEVRCQARFLPEFIEVDVSQIELGHIIHLSNLKLPKEVELAVLLHKGTDKVSDYPIVSVQVPKVVKVEEESVPVAVAAEEKDKEAKDKDNKEAKDKGGKDSKDKAKK